MKDWGIIGEVILTWLRPAVRKQLGLLRLKFLGFDICFYWPTEDWGYAIHLMFWGFGFQLADFWPVSGFYVHEDHGEWLHPGGERGELYPGGEDETG